MRVHEVVEDGFVPDLGRAIGQERLLKRMRSNAPNPTAKKQSAAAVRNKIEFIPRSWPALQEAATIGIAPRSEIGLQFPGKIYG